MEFVLTHPDTGTKGILVIFDGVPYEANSDHPWWDEIVRLCLADDERVLDLFPIRPVQKPSQEISWRAQDHKAGEDDLPSAPEDRWQPRNVEPAEEQDDENPDFPFGKNE